MNTSTASNEMTRHLCAAVHPPSFGLTAYRVRTNAMGYAFARLREADYRGVVALAQEGPVKVAVIGPASPAQVTAAHELDDIVTINDMSSAEMFFEYLTRKRMMIVKAGLAAKMIDD